MIRCNNKEIELPINTTTTPLGLIDSAANVLFESTQPPASILLESFTQLGLERRIRNYEHVRDIMNSWDHDAQNSLYLVPSSIEGADDDLDVKCVRKERPTDASVHVYYSQKPGKWDKRWITLKSDGQVQIAKNEGAEASNICHLSDYDIYIPTRRQLSKRIRPPKRLCFAVKSQQKSSIFLSTANFVHFFATNDKKVAASWYSAVHGWRSWYLVTVMGQGKTSDKSDVSVLGCSHQITGSGITPGAARQTKAPSAQSTPYQIGSLSQFRSDNCSADRPDTVSSEAMPSTSKASHAHYMTIRGKGPPLPTFPMECLQDAMVGESTGQTQASLPVRGLPPSAPNGTTFAPTGLLGRSYSHRQKTQLEREVTYNANKPATPLTGLLGGHSDQSTRASMDTDERQTLNLAATARSARKGSIVRKRVASQLPNPRPLIDLTLKYQEAQQHTQRGHGVIPHQIPVGGLVDIATSPELPLPGPLALALRRPGTSNGEGPLLQRTSATRPSLDTTRSSVKEHVDAFTGGLLAKAGGSQGGTGKGRGLVTGDRHAKGPMLDVSEKSQFVPGSLLAHVEHTTGSGGPVIERAKRSEVNMAVGEGL